MKPRLTRSKDKIIGGVCAGIWPITLDWKRLYSESGLPLSRSLQGWYP